MHNIYTLRGALVRDALEWSKQINVALYRFGQEAEVMFASHTWPRWGNDRIQEVMRTQRDIYAYLNNNVLFHANQGVTVNEIQNVYQLPQSLRQQWATHSYHGSDGGARRQRLLLRPLRLSRVSIGKSPGTAVGRPGVLTHAGQIRLRQIRDAPPLLP